MGTTVTNRALETNDKHKHAYLITWAVKWTVPSEAALVGGTMRNVFLALENIQKILYGEILILLFKILK